MDADDFMEIALITISTISAISALCVVLTAAIFPSMRKRIFVKLIASIAISDFFGSIG